VSLVHTSPASHSEHAALTPHPKSTGAQPVTIPASMASAHVDGVQHEPPLHTSFAPHAGPQLTAVPHAFFAVPQVAVPHEGAGQLSQVPAAEHCVPAGQAAQRTLPLPHALGTVPQRRPPPSAPPHSGGGGPHTPPVHCWPAGHEQLIVSPQRPATVPHRCVVESGVQVGGRHVALASTVTWGTHALFTQALLAPHPPQLIGTPQGSVPRTPHRLVQLGIWHDCAAPLPVQTFPPVHAEPQAKAVPEHGSTYRPHVMPEGQPVAGVHAAPSPPPPPLLPLLPPLPLEPLEPPEPSSPRPPSSEAESSPADDASPGLESAPEEPFVVASL
jgi:hypothetical protein